MALCCLFRLGEALLPPVTTDAIKDELFAQLETNESITETTRDIFHLMINVPPQRDLNTDINNIQTKIEEILEFVQHSRQAISEESQNIRQAAQEVKNNIDELKQVAQDIRAAVRRPAPKNFIEKWVLYLQSVKNIHYGLYIVYLVLWLFIQITTVYSSFRTILKKEKPKEN